MDNDKCYFIGVDVGTRSVRAALFSSSGTLIKIHIEKIEVYNPRKDFYEQSSTEIWEQVCICIKEVTEGIDKSSIKGLGFDATSSLVILDKHYQPISISLDQKITDIVVKDVIMWMDHRAKKETEYINSKSCSILKYVGGKIYVDMEMPKILWIKNNLESVWQNACNYFSLSDFLSFKATGKTTRSLCNLVCKWNYSIDGKNKSWDNDFLREIGLENLICEDHIKIGSVALHPGQLCGYLSDSAAYSMGLDPKTAVGVSLIDAYAGGLGLLTSKVTGSNFTGFDKKLGLVCGTSTCHIAVSNKPVFIDGLWGPFCHAILPEMWVFEGGQSSAGSLVDHIINTYKSDDYKLHSNTFSDLEKTLMQMAKKQGLSNISYLTKELHVYPDFHGNRSPLADASYKGMICGLTLDSSFDGLCLKYLATLQALTYGTKDIIEKMKSFGQEIDFLMMCGGLSKSEIFVQLYADILGIPVIIPHNRESVLLGAMMLGACASGHFGIDATMFDVAVKMGSEANIVQPTLETRSFHKKKYEVFKLMQVNWKLYKNIMD